MLLTSNVAADIFVKFHISLMVVFFLLPFEVGDSLELVKLF